MRALELFGQSEINKCKCKCVLLEMLKVGCSEFPADLKSKLWVSNMAAQCICKGGTLHCFLPTLFVCCVNKDNVIQFLPLESYFHLQMII